MTAAKHLFRGQMMTLAEIVAASGRCMSTVARAARSKRLDWLDAKTLRGREVIVDGELYQSVTAAARAIGVSHASLNSAIHDADTPALFQWTPKSLGRKLTVSMLPRRRKLRT